jgi:hypothetical protein
VQPYVANPKNTPAAGNFNASGRGEYIFGVLLVVALGTRHLWVCGCGCVCMSAVVSTEMHTDARAPLCAVVRGRVCGVCARVVHGAGYPDVAALGHQCFMCVCQSRLRAFPAVVVSPPPPRDPAVCWHAPPWHGLGFPLLGL